MHFWKPWHIGFEQFIIHSNLEGDFNKRYYIRPLGSSVILCRQLLKDNKIKITLAGVKLNIIHIIFVPLLLFSNKFLCFNKHVMFLPFNIIFCAKYGVRINQLPSHNIQCVQKVFLIPEYTFLNFDFKASSNAYILRIFLKWHIINY